MPLPSSMNNNDNDSQIQQGQQVSQHSQSSQWIKIRSAGRRNLCQNCNNIMAKYTCPKCQLKTCSLQCTRKHKIIKSCTGQRQPVEYVLKTQIDEKVVEKDYNFIEDMISSADKVKKVLSGVNNTLNLQPRRFKILRNNARQLYNIRLSNGPNILQRHRDNISFFFVKTRSIYWVYQLLYYQGSNSQIKYQKNNNLNNQKVIRTSKVITQPISDDKTFLQVLPQDYLDKQLLEYKQINTTKRQQFCVFIQNKQKYDNYSRDRVDNNKKQLRQNSILTQTVISGKFMTLFELIKYDLNIKINEQMKDIAIFEFPTLYIVHKSLREQFIKNYKQTKLNKGQNNQKYRGQNDQKNSDQKSDRSEQVKQERQRSRQKTKHKKSKLSTIINHNKQIKQQ